MKISAVAICNRLKLDNDSLRILRKLQEGLILCFGHNALGMTDNDLCDHSHYISAHVDGRRKEGGDERKARRERCIAGEKRQRSAKVGEWCFREKAKSFAERLWRDGGFLTASARYWRADRKIDAKQQTLSVRLRGCLSIFSPYGTRISHHLSLACIFLTPFRSLARLREIDEKEINASSRNLCRETRDNENVIYRKYFRLLDD